MRALWLHVHGPGHAVLSDLDGDEQAEMVQVSLLAHAPVIDGDAVFAGGIVTWLASLLLKRCDRQDVIPPLLVFSWYTSLWLSGMWKLLPSSLPLGCCRLLQQHLSLKKGTMGEEHLFREDSAPLERNGWGTGLAPLRQESLFEGMNVGARMRPLPQMRSTGRIFCA